MSLLKKLPKQILTGLLTIVFSYSTSFAATPSDENTKLKTDGSNSGLNGERFVAKTEAVKVNPDDNGIYSVKCWQNGIVIFEDNNKSMPNIQAKTITMFSLAGTSPDLYIVDMGSGVCRVTKK